MTIDALGMDDEPILYSLCVMKIENEIKQYRRARLMRLLRRNK